MTPVTRCLHRFDHTSAVTDTTVVESVLDALTELEAAYHRPSDKIVALEAVLQGVMRRGATIRAPFVRFVYTVVERRQDRLARMNM